MPNPTLKHKSPTSNEPFTYTWGAEALLVGATALDRTFPVVWAVDPSSTITLNTGDSRNNEQDGLTSTTFVNGGTPNEVAVLWAEATFDTGDKVTKQFWIYIDNETAPMFDPSTSQNLDFQLG